VTATRPPTALPSATPSETATELPGSATPAATAEPFPILPDEPWPAPTSHPFPVSGAPRQGIAAALGAGDESAFGSWSYFYNAFVPPIPGRAQHVPMLTSRPSNGLPERSIIEDMDQRASHNYWLVFNECDHVDQCNASPQEAAAFYHDVVVETLYNQGADSDAELIVGGVSAHPCGIQWLADFVNTYEANYGELPRAGWHFHNYPEMRPSAWPGGCNNSWAYDDGLFPDPEAAADLWIEHANNALAFVQEYGRPEDEIWFTEIGCLNYGFHQEQRPVCQADGFIQDYASRILAWLNNQGRWVTRYAWYTNWDIRYWEITHLLSEAGPIWQYSPLGYYYAQVTPAASTGQGGP
jgi:hypothetical protein